MSRGDGRASRVRGRTPAELDAVLDGGASGNPRLDELLSAASAPARPQEEGPGAPALAMAKDAAAHLPERSTSRRVFARLGTATLLTKAAIASASAVVVGAAAVAGATGHLPGQTRHHRAPVVVPSSTDASSSSEHDSSAPSTDRKTSSSPTRTPSSSSSRTSPSGSASTSAAAGIPLLCKVWLALPTSDTASRHQPRFVILIRAAGGIDAVTSFCRKLPTQSPSSTRSSSTRSSTTSRSPSPSTTSSRARRTPSPKATTSTSHH